jgi:hypothetical protein
MTIVSELDLILKQLDLLIDSQLNKDDQELFVEQVNKYLTDLEAWQIKNKIHLDYLTDSKINKNIEKNQYLESIRIELKDVLEKIEMKHSKVFEATKFIMDEIGGEMGKVNKSSKVIKKYLDIFPISTLNVKKEG